MGRYFRIVLLLGLIILFPVSGYCWPISDTGQTKCYDNEKEIACPKPGEPFYGQDGNYLINPPSYTKLDQSGNELQGDATEWVMVRDNFTGLVWEVKQNKDDLQDYSNPHDADNIYTWYNGNPETNAGNMGIPGEGTDTEDIINSLNANKFGGHSDWRLPNVVELASIADISRYWTAIDEGYFPNTVLFEIVLPKLVHESSFPNIVYSYYWSATTSAYNKDDAWSINFNYGYGKHGDKANSRSVRAVRGGQPRSLGILVINDGDTATDAQTGLMWQRTTSEAAMDWENALAHCNALSLGGFNDWRLPTLKELRSIIDYGKYPSLDSDVFLIADTSHYWSSTTSAFYEVDAWYVDFNYGEDYANYKSNSRYVRALRGGQVRLLGHLVIFTPRQADFWETGDQMPISWETQDIPGNVKITLSRDGGKTFGEVIAESTLNDGSQNWTITSPASYNCVLKIEPLNDPTKSTSQGLFSILEGEAQPPQNDDVSSPFVITGQNGSTSGSTKYATISPDEPDHFGRLPWDRSAWWQWVAEESGTITIDTIGSDFDTLLAVYSGDDTSNLRKIMDDDQSGDNNAAMVSFPAIKGQTYWIVVAGYDGASGTVRLNWDQQVVLAPPNDNFTHAFPLSGQNDAMTFDNINATREYGEPLHAGAEGGASVWWTWTPQKTGTVEIKAESGDVDAVLAVYTGSSVGNLSLIAENDNDGVGTDSRVSFRVSPGVTYYIAVDSADGAGGEFLITLAQTIDPPPVNDDLANAVSLAGDEGQITGENFNATLETDEPVHIDKSIDNSVWWQWTAQRSGALTLDTIGSNFDTILEVYRLVPDDFLEPIAADDDGGSDYLSKVACEATIGQTYYISVSGAGGQSGDIVLNWRQTGLLVNSLAPASCVESETVELVISGSGFDDATRFWIYKDASSKTELAPVSVAGSTEATAPFVPLTPGKYTIEAANASETQKRADAFTVIPADNADVLNAKAVIVAGDGPGSDILSEITWCADKAYDTLIKVGYDANDIYYLTPDDSIRKSDGPPSFQAIEEIFNYLTTSPPYDLVIYFVGHGESNRFWLNKTERESLDRDQLAGWLNNVQQVMAGGHLVFVYDACFAGSFVTDDTASSPLAGPGGGNRVVISSTEPKEKTEFPSSGYGTFSDCFWSFIGNGHPVRDAFYAAEEKMRDWDQHPMLDADGNGRWDPSVDADMANFTIGISDYDSEHPIELPRIIEVMPLHRLPEDAYSANLWIKASTPSGSMDRVWATVIPPDYSYGARGPDGDAGSGRERSADFDVSEVDLEFNNENDRYEADYPYFIKAGAYSIIFRARNTAGYEANIRNSAVVKPTGPNYATPDAFEPDDGPTDAHPILPDNIGQAHTFHAYGDEDWTSFIGRAGTLYKFTAEYASSACDPIIQLFDAAGNPVIDEFGDPLLANQRGLGEPEIMDWRCPSNGVYYLKAWNASPDVFGQTVNYSLSITRAEGPSEFTVQLQLRDWATGEGVENAEISFLDAHLLPSDSYYPYLGDGYYQTIAAASAGTRFQINVTRDGLIPFSSEYTLTSARGILSVNVALMPVRLDAVLALLQIAAGGPMPQVEFGGPFQMGGDIDLDGRWGLVEVAYVLQKIGQQ